MDELPAGRTPPAGRRGNGLLAADWGALVDLDPRLSDGLLERLALAGVAAYVEPATSVDTVHRAVTMPGRPLDRLWVDPERAESAREVVASEVADLTALLREDDPGGDPDVAAHGLVSPIPRTAGRRVLAPPSMLQPREDSPPPDPPPAPDQQPELPALDDDAIFAQIVAGFSSNGDPLPSWPEDPPDPPVRPYRRASDPAPPSPVPTPPSPADEEEHFVPPPPPAVPRVRVRTLAACAAVVLGLLLLFAPGLLGVSASREIGVLGLVTLSGGATALVWFLRDGPGDGDDGAVV